MQYVKGFSGKALDVPGTRHRHDLVHEGNAVGHKYIRWELRECCEFGTFIYGRDAFGIICSTVTCVTSGSAIPYL